MRKKEGNLIPTTVYAGIVVGLAACNGAEAPVQSGDPLTGEAQVVAPGKEIPVKSMSMGEQIKFATEELAQRLDTTSDSMTLIGARKVNWRSGALGCPQPGMNYTQALVPGVLILLQVDGKSFGYHAKDGAKPFHCPRERVEVPASTQAEDPAHFFSPTRVNH